MANPAIDLSQFMAQAGAQGLNSLADLPFHPIRGGLYTTDELLAGFDTARPESFAETRDFQIYRYFVRAGGATAINPLASIMEALHDNCISQALAQFLAAHRPVVAIMGGHKMGRDSATYRAVAGIAHSLARAGFLLASGGGPGCMEATHLGALLSSQPESALDHAFSRLQARSVVPAAQNILDAEGNINGEKVAALHDWLAPAVAIRAEVGEPGVSLAVPTWHYGHEPFTPFASHVAKYFQNSIREDGLLAFAEDGIVYAPGAAGTVQEIFQDAAQNFYHSYGQRFSPMVFFGVDFWTNQLPVVDLLTKLCLLDEAKRAEREQELKANVLVTDSVNAVVAFLAGRAGGR